MPSTLQLTKYKGRDTSEIIENLEEEKDKKMDEQTKQYLEIELKREQDRIEHKEKHEEKVLMMFSSFMNQMMQMIAAQMYTCGISHFIIMHLTTTVPYPPANQSVPGFNRESSLNTSDSASADHSQLWIIHQMIDSVCKANCDQIN